MKILFYRYGSICEPAMIKTFKKYQLEIVEEVSEITNKSITPKECATIVSNYLSENCYLFVFSINYYPALSEICQLYKVPYVCWVVDCPVLELYSDTIKNPVNRIFLFDRAMYHEFSKENPNGIFYLPLAGDIEVMSNACNSTTPSLQEHFSSDISFVGSLYTEKSPLSHIQLPDFLDGYIDGIIESQLKIYGAYIIREALSKDMAAQIKSQLDFYQYPKDARQDDIAVLSDWYLGMKAAAIERTRTLQTLSNYFDVDLYTGSDTSSLSNVHCKGTVKTLTEMPLVFRNSKINLNMTIRPIRTGLSLRIWDVLSCGGFLMTNYQEELSDYFEIGKDLEVYHSIEELVDKCDFYLKNEDLRKKIACTGFEKVRNYHTYEIRVSKLMKKIEPNLF